MVQETMVNTVDVTVSLKRFTPEDIEEYKGKVINQAKKTKTQDDEHSASALDSGDKEGLSDAQHSSSDSDIDSYKLRGKKILVSKTEKKVRRRKRSSDEKNFSSDSEVGNYGDKYKLRKIKSSALRQIFSADKRGKSLRKKNLSDGSDSSNIDRKTMRKIQKVAARKVGRKDTDDINFSSDSEVDYAFKYALKNIKKSAIKKSRKMKVLQTKNYFISSDEDDDAICEGKIKKTARRSGRTQRIQYKEKRSSDTE